MPVTFSIPLAGVTVGHAIDDRVMTGTTACLFAEPAVAAVQVQGGAPGTREIELLDPKYPLTTVDALILSGGSAYGLDAAGGAQAWLREHDRGVDLPPVRIPIVPCAILFDMRNDGDKNWGKYSPYRELGYEAISQTTREPALGRIGAAYGATTANAPGGFGMATTQLDGGGSILAMAAVNAMGSAYIADTEYFWAAPFEVGDEFGGRGSPDTWPNDADVARTKSGARIAGVNTTLAIVVTDVTLTNAQAKRIALSAHDGFSRALYPVHTSGDGDLVFVASTGRHRVSDETLLDVGVLAANTVTRAIARGVYEAGR